MPSCLFTPHLLLVRLLRFCVYSLPVPLFHLRALLLLLPHPPNLNLIGEAIPRFDDWPSLCLPVFGHLC